MSVYDPPDLRVAHKTPSRWGDVKPKPITSSDETLVKFSFLESDQTLPLVLEPRYKHVNLMDWVKNNMELIEVNLLRYGGILFRGFGLTMQEHFEQFLQASSVTLMQYMEGATPRTELGEKIYTSTEFPPDRTISIHNELCYVSAWPMKIFFYCIQPAESGGETPIGDVRKVLQRIPPHIQDRFRQKGWMLLRNFGSGFGLPWQTSYHISDKSALEEYFHTADISYEWGKGDSLRTRQVRPAIAVHPKTTEPVWFNHIGFWHVSSLDQEIRRLFLGEFKEHGLPFNTYYGDGTPIESAVIDQLRFAYESETKTFAWRQGDVLMLDNMLTAHGRRPYTGARKILTAMGEMYSPYST